MIFLAAPLGVLKCHISRANAPLKDFDPDVEALAIFSGAEHYISPNWYAEKQETGRWLRRGIMPWCMPMGI